MNITLTCQMLLTHVIIVMQTLELRFSHAQLYVIIRNP